MYAGTTLLKSSGKFAGVHQKIDRIARLNIIKNESKSIKFPLIKDILYFEGNNGPDGIKRKTKAQDEPWHFINPADPNDKDLLIIISNHMYNLIEALKEQNNTRASFEAAWLAHSIVDGLTPAHHYPLSDKIEELWGKGHGDRTSVKSKVVIKGDGLKDTLSKNWQYIGADGVFTAHLLFEGGVASAITTIKFKKAGPTELDVKDLRKDGFEKMYLDSVKKVYSMKMYEAFCRYGWSWGLAKQTRKVLIPEIIKMVSLAWSEAIIKAKEA
jgi:hypothetical protein